MSYITGSQNTDLLDRLTAETAVLDAQLAAEARKGPHQCCSDFAFLLLCDGDTDLWYCDICKCQWIAPCR